MAEARTAPPHGPPRRAPQTIRSDCVSRGTGGRKGDGMQGGTRERLRQQVVGAIDEHGPGIVNVSDQIHKRPEIGYQERFASQLLADSLRKQGYEVEMPLGGLETAFRASKRGKGPGPAEQVQVSAARERPMNLYGSPPSAPCPDGSSCNCAVSRFANPAYRASSAFTSAETRAAMRFVETNR